jgi:hypothetical protein
MMILLFEKPGELLRFAVVAQRSGIGQEALNDLPSTPCGERRRGAISSASQPCPDHFRADWAA